MDGYSRQGRKCLGRWVSAIAALFMLLATIAGCAQNSSSNWAQTSPLIRAEKTNPAAFNLGLRGE